MEEVLDFIGEVTLRFINPKLLSSLREESQVLQGPHSYSRKYEKVHVTVWSNNREPPTRNRFEVTTARSRPTTLAEGWYDHNLYLEGNRSFAFGNEVTSFHVHSPSEPRGVALYFDAPIFGNDQTFSDLFLRNSPTLPITTAIRKTLPMVSRMKTWFFSSYSSGHLDPLESSRFPISLPKSISRISEVLADYVVNEFVIKFRLPVLPTSKIRTIPDGERQVTVDLLGYDLVSFIVGKSYVRTEEGEPRSIRPHTLRSIIFGSPWTYMRMTPVEMYILAIKINENFHDVEYYHRRE